MRVFKNEVRARYDIFARVRVFGKTPFCTKINHQKAQSSSVALPHRVLRTPLQKNAIDGAIESSGWRQIRITLLGDG